MLNLRAIFVALALAGFALASAPVGAAVTDATTCVEVWVPGTTTAASDGYVCAGSYETPSGTRCSGAIVAVGDEYVQLGPCV